VAFRFKRKAHTKENSSVRQLLLTTSTGLSDAEVGSTYSTRVEATGGVLPYVSFAVIGTLPSGLSMTSSGEFSGTPSTTVISTFSVEVRDAVGSTARESYRLQVNSSGASGPLELSIQNSTGAPQGVVNSSYSLQFNSTGGIAPYSSFALVGGVLPAGLSLGSGGLLSGTPSTTGVSTFTVQVKDNVGSTARQSFRLNVLSSAAASDSNALGYFNSLVTHPNFFRGFPLNDQSSLNTYNVPVTDPEKLAIPATDVFTYIWPTDSYSDPQEACKMRIVPNSTLRNSDGACAQLRFPCATSTGSLFITWDSWYGSEWRENSGACGTFKAFQLSDGESTNLVHIYLEPHTLQQLANGTSNAAMVDIRGYGMATSSASASFVPGLTNQGSYRPTGQGALSPQTYGIKPQTWTRSWLEVNLLHPSSLFTEWNAISSRALSTGLLYRRVSLWMADEVSDPQRVYYRVPWRVRHPFLTKFWLEFDNSNLPSSNGSPTGLAGELTAYFKGVLMLHDATIDESDTSIFKKPVG
jgi:hypothetical protein